MNVESFDISIIHTSPSLIYFKIVSNLNDLNIKPEDDDLKVSVFCIKVQSGCCTCPACVRLSVRG